MLSSHVTFLVRLLTRVIPNRIAALTGKRDHQSGLAACYRLPRLLSCEGFPRKHGRDYLVLLRVGRSFAALEPRTRRVTCVYCPSLILWVGFAIGVRSAGLKFVRWVRCHCRGCPSSLISPVPGCLSLLIENFPQTTPPLTFAASPDPLLPPSDPSSRVLHLVVGYTHESPWSLSRSTFYRRPLFHITHGCFLEFPFRVRTDTQYHRLGSCWLLAAAVAPAQLVFSYSLSHIFPAPTFRVTYPLTLISPHSSACWPSEFSVV